MFQYAIQFGAFEGRFVEHEKVKGVSGIGGAGEESFDLRSLQSQPRSHSPAPQYGLKNRA